MSVRLPDFESCEYDSADVIREDARIDAWEAQLDADREQLQAAFVHTAAVQEAVSQCLGSCLACLDVLYLQRDAYPFSEVARAHNSWQQEAEPEPCSRDAWLRGALPETVVPARVPFATPSSQTASQNALVKDARGGLLSRSRKGPSSVASSAAADDPAGGRPQSKAQQSRRTSLAQSAHSMKVTEGCPAAAAAAGSRPGTSTTTGQRPLLAAAGNVSNPAAAAATRPSTAQRFAAAAAAGEAVAVEPTAAAAGALSAPAGAPPAAAATAAVTQTAPARSTGRKQPSRVSHLSQDEQEAEDRLRQELQLRRQQEAVVKELKQKDAAARAALLNMQKDMKGKDYTYDGKGKVVLLAKVNPDALPAPPGPQFKVQLNTAATVDAAAAAAAAAAAGTAGSGAAGALSAAASAASKASKPAAAGAKAGSSSNKGAAAAGAAPGTFYVEQASRSQPPLLQSLKPSAGVTLKVGGGAKQGPRKDTAQQQTRTQYQQQAKTLNQQAAKAAAGAGLGALGGHTSSSRASSAVTQSSSNGGRGVGGGSRPGSVAAGGAAEGAEGRSSRLSSAGGRASSAGGAAAAAAAAAAAGEGQSRSGSAAGAAGPSRINMSQSGASSAAAAGKAAGGCVQCSSGPDINLLLVNAPDWGVASGGGPRVVPQAVDVVKPSDRRLQEEFGRTTHLPKSRAPVATLKPPKKQPPSTTRLSQLAKLKP